MYTQVLQAFCLTFLFGVDIIAFTECIDGNMILWDHENFTSLRNSLFSKLYCMTTRKSEKTNADIYTYSQGWYFTKTSTSDF